MLKKLREASRAQNIAESRHISYIEYFPNILCLYLSCDNKPAKYLNITNYQNKMLKAHKNKGEVANALLSGTSDKNLTSLPAFSPKILPRNAPLM